MHSPQRHMPAAAVTRTSAITTDASNRYPRVDARFEPPAGRLRLQPHPSRYPQEASALHQNQTGDTGNSQMRRYRVALDIPRSRATWVAGSPPSISRSAARIWESVKVGRRPSRSLPTTLRLATESVIRSR